MSEIFMLIVILLPLLGGILVPLLHFKSRRSMLIYMETVVVLTSGLMFLLLLNRPEEALTVFRFTGNLSITLRIDGLGSLYAGLVAFLWPFAMLYYFEYM